MKFVSESLEDIFKPKTREDIKRDLEDILLHFAFKDYFSKERYVYVYEIKDRGYDFLAMTKPLFKEYPITGTTAEKMRRSYILPTKKELLSVYRAPWKIEFIEKNIRNK